MCSICEKEILRDYVRCSGAEYDKIKLVCKHKFHHECFLKHTASKRMDKQKVKCPVCDVFYEDMKLFDGHLHKDLFPKGEFKCTYEYCTNPKLDYEYCRVIDEDSIKCEDIGVYGCEYYFHDKCLKHFVKSRRSQGRYLLHRPDHYYIYDAFNMNEFISNMISEK